MTRLLFTSVLCTLAALLAGCPEDETPQKETEPVQNVSLTERLDAHEARCGAVQHSEELIGGPVAYGEPGNGFKCYNNKIRFFVQNETRPLGVSSIGASLIDLDLVRDNTPESGADTFKELVPAPGTGEVLVERMEVINDGTDGNAAILRVTGRPTPNTIVPTAYVIYQEIPGTVRTDYILRPNASYVEIKTTIFNETDDFIGPLLMGDFIAMGGGTRVFTPEYGFDEVPLFSDVEFFAGVMGEKVSYAYSCPNGPALAPIVESGITAPVCDDEMIVAYEESSTRYLHVGDGTLESVAAPIWAMKEISRGVVEGTVASNSGEGLVNVLVSALNQDLDQPGARVVNQTRTAEDGSFSMHLPLGDYFLLAHHLGHERSETVAVNVVSEQKATIQLQMRGQAHLTVTTEFFDLNGAPSAPQPAKLSLLPRETTQRPNRLLGEWVAKDLSNYHLSVDGSFDVQIPPGTYTAYVSRGFTFSRFSADFTVLANDSHTLEAELYQAIDTNGFVGSEFHQHSWGSVDANVPIPTRVMENAAEGIQFVAATEHDNIVDFQPFINRLGVSNFIKAVPGNEITYTGGIGHFNVYPWNIDPEDPYRDLGSHMWFMTTAPSLFAKLRQAAGAPLIQINHPRAGFSGYFSQMGLNPVDGSFAPRSEATIPVLPTKIYLDWSNDFEVVEVNGNLGSPSLFTQEGRASLSDLALNSPESVPAFADYFALLGSGHDVVATGNSDAHGANNMVGYPRSFVRVDESAFQAWNQDDVREALRAQRAAVGQGCLVLFDLEGQHPMGKNEALGPSDLTSLRIKVQAPTFVKLNRLEIYINGIVQTLTETNDEQLAVGTTGTDALFVSLAETDSNSTTARYLKSVSVDLEQDAVLIAVVRGGTGLYPTGNGSPFCYSGPTYVDVDQDGFAPWLTNSKF